MTAPGPSYYLESLTWGLGWGSALAAAVGVVWEWRRNRMRALLLALFPVILFAYLCTQGRFFARWMMPTYPILALLAGIALAGLAARVPGPVVAARGRARAAARRRAGPADRRRPADRATCSTGRTPACSRASSSSPICR